MAQQVFPQWSPVVRAHNEDQQEVYIPAAIIHAQTRDGKDELIVGAANMQFDPDTGDYLPTHAGNPVEVRARALETLLQTLGKEETLALVKAALDVLVSKDFATQTTLVAVLEKLADLATESTLDGVKSAVDALAGTVDAGAQKVTLSGSARLVAMGLNEVIPPGVAIFRPDTNAAPVIQAHRRYGFILTFVGVPEENRRVRVNMALRRLMPNGSKSGSVEYLIGSRSGVLVADGSPGTPGSLVMEPVHVPAEWINFSILNTGTEDVTTNWYLVEV